MFSCDQGLFTGQKSQKIFRKAPPVDIYCLTAHCHVQGPRTQRSLKWNKMCFWKFGRRISSIPFCTVVWGAQLVEKCHPTYQDQLSGNLEVQIYGFRDFHLINNYWIWFEMGPYGSVWAHIKTGRSPMAQDHFKTPPDPPKGYKSQKMSQKISKLVGVALG